MNNRKRMRRKLNFVSIVFSIVSLISMTLAWFAYSGMSNTSVDVNVKAWYIELERNGEKTSNQIVISLDDIYPGMDVHSERIKIKNLGDSDAQLKFSIESVRIFDEPEINTTNYTEEEFLELEDNLSHEYPFHVNMSLDKNYVLSKSDEAVFNVSVSWPLDSGNDELDAYWGNQSYSFKNSEEDKKRLDQTYLIRPSIKIVLKLTAEQYFEDEDSLDLNYVFGNSIRYDVVQNEKCDEISNTCLNLKVIDTENKIKDSSVTFIPSLGAIQTTSTYNDYNSAFNNETSSWNVETKKLALSDVLNIISKDVFDSIISSDTLSDEIVGFVRKSDRIGKQISSFSTYNKLYKFSNQNTLLLSSDCYWIDMQYDSNKAFAVVSNMEYSQIYGEQKTSNCKVVPLITLNKADIN